MSRKPIPRNGAVERAIRDIPLDVDGRELGEMCYLDQDGRVQDKALWDVLLGEDGTEGRPNRPDPEVGH